MRGSGAHAVAATNGIAFESRLSNAGQAERDGAILFAVSFALPELRAAAKANALHTPGALRMVAIALRAACLTHSAAPAPYSQVTPSKRAERSPTDS